MTVLQRPHLPASKQVHSILKKLRRSRWAAFTHTYSCTLHGTGMLASWYPHVLQAHYCLCICKSTLRADGRDNMASRLVAHTLLLDAGAFSRRDVGTVRYGQEGRLPPSTC